MDAPAGFPLRALGIGEIFDRAITIYVRNFVVFTLIVLTVFVPFAVVEYFVVPNDTTQFQQVLDQIQHPTKASKAGDMEAARPQRLLSLLALLGVVSLIAPFANTAVAVGVAAVYFGKRPDYRNSYATALRRWPGVIGTTIALGLVVAGVYISGVIAVTILGMIGVLLVRFAWPIAILFFILAVAGIIALMLLLLMMVIMFAFGIYAVSLENAGVGRAIAESFRRVFNRAEIGKAMLMSLAIAGIQLGVFSMSMTIAFIFEFVLKSYALQLATSAITNAIATAFVTVIFAVYYYDVRTRREGLDLEADLARLTPA